jgi:predicted ATPase
VEITIKHIGRLPKAKIILDGLTVIAGENDTGKSTVGKVLFSIIKANNMATANQHCQFMNNMVNLVFDSQISNQGEVILLDKGVPIYSINFSQHQCVCFECCQPELPHFFKESTFIQTPLVWDLVDFFDSVLRLKQNQEMTQNIAPFSIKYPYIFWDVYVKMTNTPVEKDSQTNDLVKNIRQIIQGGFEQRDKRIVFQRQNESILLMNVAAGIKYFGLLQRLAENNQLKPENLLIIDEPENHLHPKWQLCLAELIVNLVNQYKVYVLINSHSPYLIEALKVYSDISIKDKTSFYFNELTHKGLEVKEVTDDLSFLFDTLSLPFKKLEQTVLGIS